MVVVVTDQWARKLALGILSGACATLVLYGCGVNTSSPSTPKAFSCNPQGTDVANFTTTAFASLNANGCLVCHGNKLALPAPFTGNRFRLNTDPASTSAEQTENLCICYLFGQLSPAQTLITHPQDAKHDGNVQNGGGPWSPSQLAPIITWVQTYRLPAAPQ